MIWRIDVFSKNRQSQSALVSQIKDLGFKGKISVYFQKVYFIEASFSEPACRRIAEELLVDPPIEDYSIGQGFFPLPPKENQILITYNAGVCDPVALSLQKAINDLSLKVDAVRTGRFYEFEARERLPISDIAQKLLYNPLIEHQLDYRKYQTVTTLDEFAGSDYTFKLITVDILKADDRKLEAISRQGCLSLNLDEMRIIKEYFKKLKRNPTDCELETIATLWSEHCAHKTFRGIIDYTEKDEKGKVLKREIISNLLKSTVMKATHTIKHPDCVSVFHDNSGVVRFDEHNNVCFKVETHNHPSSLEPYGGASTGIGGVIRDILGTGCAAKPFASIDVFCFSPWHIKYDEVPQGLLHPKRIIKGVVRGVRDYGNRMGIPTVAGAVLFDRRFLGNPLVYCGTLGIMPKGKSFKQVKSGDLVVLCGARTGRDGIHGATFSSKELDEHTVSLTSAVQIGNAIEEKKLTEAILRSRDKDLFDAITDCGAGGISSAITELAQEHGVRVDLEKVPLKYRGLSYSEIWISESQERMVFFTSAKNLQQLREIFSEEDVELSVVGEVTDTKKLELFYEQKKVCELDMDFIFNLPKLKKQALWIKKDERNVILQEKADYSQDLKGLLGRENIAAKDWVVREYDHEVQGGSVMKAIAGIAASSVNDAAIVRPDLESAKSVVVGLGINPFYSDLDPYWMAALAIDEALRNVIAAGGSLSKTFILDNFCWGSPDVPEVLGALVKAANACYDFSTYYGVPFISGKDSLYNEYMVGKKHISIPGTLLISAISIVPDWHKTVSADFKKEGNLIYLLGLTKPELGGSEYFRSLNLQGGIVPKIERDSAKHIFEKLSAAIAKGLVASCHDLSEGGLAVSLAEMCISSNKGASVFLAEVAQKDCQNDYELLFSESPTRFLVEVQKEKKQDFENALDDVVFGLIGYVAKEPKLIVHGHQSKPIIACDIRELRDCWMKTFDEFRYSEVRP